MKKWVAHMLTAGGLVPAYGAVRGRLTGERSAILMYHRVTAVQDNWSLPALHPAAFAEQMAWFVRHYDIIPLDRLAQRLADGARPGKTLAVTFDDGYKDNYRHAFPVLKKFGVPATVFLTTGAIDTGELLWFDRIGYALWHTSVRELRLESLGDIALGSLEKKAGARNRIVRHLKSLPEDARQAVMETLIRQCGVTVPEGLGRSLMLSWEEIREMAASGICFGAHGVTHPILTNVPADRARREMTQSKAEIEQQTGRPVSAFAWPDGKFSPELIGMARESGYACAVSSKPYAPRRPLRPGDDPYALARLETHDLDKTRILLSGLAGDAETLLRRSRL